MWVKIGFIISQSPENDENIFIKSLYFLFSDLFAHSSACFFPLALNIELSLPKSLPPGNDFQFRFMLSSLKFEIV